MKDLLKKLYDYYPVIHEDEDWDYGFLLALIDFKLKRMIKYFRESEQLVEHQLEYAKQMETALNILHAGYLTGIVTQEDLGSIYVNDRNVHRFFNPSELQFLGKWKTRYYYPTVRETKAKRLFWKYLERYIEYWWI